MAPRWAPTPPYADRAAAGRILAERLIAKVPLDDPVVLALPRGGVPVAFEVSARLDAPLDILVVRKLGVPGHEELAMGAIASGGQQVLNHDLIASLRITPDEVRNVAVEEQRELDRRERAYREGHEPVPLDGRQVVLIDDGLATGATMRAAALAARTRGAREIIVAVPVAAAQTCDEIDAAVDRTVCVFVPEPFFGVGQWYRDFDQTTDDQVRDLLARARGRAAAARRSGR